MNRLLIAGIVIVGVPLATVLYVAVIEWILARLGDRLRARLRPWLWLAPALGLLLVYLVYPTVNTIYLSFLDARSTSPVGLDNYVFAFTNPDMLLAFRNNFLWLVFFTLCTVSFGLIIAVLWGTATSTVLALAAGELGALLVLLTVIRREVRRRIVAAPALGLDPASATPASRARQ